jgi:hypothetical protein
MRYTAVWKRVSDTSTVIGEGSDIGVEVWANEGLTVRQGYASLDPGVPPPATESGARKSNRRPRIHCLGHGNTTASNHQEAYPYLPVYSYPHAYILLCDTDARNLRNGAARAAMGQGPAENIH